MAAASRVQLRSHNKEAVDAATISFRMKDGHFFSCLLAFKTNFDANELKDEAEVEKQNFIC